MYFFFEVSPWSKYSTVVKLEDLAPFSEAFALTREKAPVGMAGDLEKVSIVGKGITSDHIDPSFPVSKILETLGVEHPQVHFHITPPPAPETTTPPKRNAATAMMDARTKLAGGGNWAI